MVSVAIVGNDSDINMQTSSTPEFDGWRWVSYWYPVRQVVSFKRDVYRRVMKEFASVVMQLQEIRLSRRAHLPGDVKRLSYANHAHPLARNSREVASAPRLNEALNILVTDICLAMETEVCSVYLADHDRRCYYLMATRGLKPRGRTVTLAFDEGIVGLVGRLAEPINLADAQKHPSFKYIPSVKEERFRAFRAYRSSSVVNCLAYWSFSSANCVSMTKAKSLSS